MQPSPEQGHEHRWAVEMPYGVETLAATAALMQTWSDITFQRALARRVEDDPDLQVQFLVRHILTFGPSRPRELAGALGMTRSNVSKIVGRAEERGLIERRGLSDGRAVELVLSDAGTELARRTMEVGDQMMRQLTIDWTDDERRSWVDLSHRLARAAAVYARALTASSSDDRAAGRTMPDEDTADRR